MYEHNISNKDLTIFFLVAFGLTIGMGIAMSFVYTKYEMGAFAHVQMYYPAIGVMIALLVNKERRKKLPMKFYGTYLFFTITSILFLLVEIFLLHKSPSGYIEMWGVLAGFATLITCSFPDEKEKMNAFGLGFGKKTKASAGYMMLFFILYICANILRILISGNAKEIITFLQSIKAIIRIPFSLALSFILQFVMFLGEEYGWRYFLQPALQQRVGKRKGIILLGVIWGIWHLPLSLFYYSPNTSLYSILNKLIVCISYSIFFGFVYMKTENIWTISIIHFLNNIFSFILNGSNGVNVTLSGELVLLNLICMSIVYLPFIFTKEYRKYKEKTDMANEL